MQTSPSPALHLVRSVLCAAAAIAVLSGASVSAQKDTVRLADGTSETGTIKTEEIGGLTITGAAGKTRTLPWKQVAGVQYGGSAEFTRMMTAIGQGNVAESLPLIEQLAADSKLRPVLRQHVLMNLALVKQRSGKPAEALAAYDTLVQEFPKTRFYATIADGLFACHVAQNQVAAGKAALDKLGAAAASAGADRGVLSSIDIAKARLLEVQKDYAGARLAYESSRVAGLAAEIEADITLGIARCMQAEGKAADAERSYRALVANPASPRHVLAGAWNGIADGLREDGKKNKNTDRLLEALFAHLRGVVQYAPAPGEPTIEHERALGGAAQCFKYLAELEKDPERRTLFGERARERKAQLERDYPNTPYLAGL